MSANLVHTRDEEEEIVSAVPTFGTFLKVSRMNVEQERIGESAGLLNPWRTWGPYLSERQWGTVREDYSPDGSRI